MQAAELRVKTEKELSDELIKLKRELLNMRFQKASGENLNTIKKRGIRKDIARVYTVLNVMKKQNNNKVVQNA